MVTVVVLGVEEVVVVLFELPHAARKQARATTNATNKKRRQLMYSSVASLARSEWVFRVGTQRAGKWDAIPQTQDVSGLPAGGDDSPEWD